MSLLSLASLNLYEVGGGLAALIFVSAAFGAWVGGRGGVSSAYREQARQYKRR